DVRDTGIGIAPEKQTTIFEAFAQADGSTTRRHGGTGLGLAIAAQLVEMMHGELRVESELGRGSTFRFTARFALRAETGDGRVRPEPASLRGLRVLIVDDNATNQKILEELVRKWRMQPSVAGDGAT